MSEDKAYISPEYNPHSLQRDWGFVISAERRDVFDTLPKSLGTIRAALYQSALQRAVPELAISSAEFAHPAKVTTDDSFDQGEKLCHEVGLDIMALALLADVPIHRPLHLTQSSLIGHWRWLRDVWRVASSRPKCAAITLPPSGLAKALQDGKNNLAIARLRDMFKKLQTDLDNPELHISFLSSLSLFCPFIATELLWRQGRIKHEPARSRSFGTKGNVETYSPGPYSQAK